MSVVVVAYLSRIRIQFVDAVNVVFFLSALGYSMSLVVVAYLSRIRTQFVDAIYVVFFLSALAYSFISSHGIIAYNPFMPF